MSETKNKILIIDIETTGFLKNGGSIVEIGAVELDLDTSEITEVFNSLCREKILNSKHRDAWIFSNSDLTVEMVRDAPEFEDVAIKFQELINSYPLGLTSYNRIFDVTFLHDRGFTFPKLLPCPMLLSTDICEIPSPYGGNKWPKVEEAFNHFFPDFPYIEKHRAAHDALHEAMIVFKLFKMDVFKITK